MLLLADNI